MVAQGRETQKIELDQDCMPVLDKNSNKKIKALGSGQLFPHSNFFWICFVAMINSILKNLPKRNAGIPLT